MKPICIALAVCLALPALAQETYGGPSVLSRGPSGNLPATSDLLVLRPSLELVGSYESGFLIPGVDTSGNPLSGASYGAAAVASLTGYHRWKHTIAGLSYQGHFRHYTRNPYMDGIDQMLSFNVQRQTSARTSFSVTGTGGTYSRGYGFGILGNPLNYGDYSQTSDPTLNLVPTYDLLDTRTYYAAGGADVIHQRTARLSIHAGGSAFAVRRRNRALVELDGYNARGDIMYRVSRASTVGVDYAFNSFRFVRSFGASDIHTTALNFSSRLNRNWTLALRGGGYRLENQRVVQVALDPLVAAILGQSAGIEAVHKINYGSIFGASLSRNFRRAGLVFDYKRDINPGNGILLTMRTDSGAANFSYRGWKRFAVTLNFDASRSVTTFQNYGSFRYYSGTGSASYRLGRFIHLVGHSGLRRYDLQYAGRSRDSYLASIGLGFTPNEMPLSLW